jgi:fatty acid synthase subunit alpha
MDFAIVRLVLICLSLCIRSHSQFTGYYEICRPRICPPQRRPLKLVHISNGLRMVEGAGPLQVGDVFRSEASVTNTDATLLGSRITCIMTSRHRSRFIFIYRSRFNDYEDAFRTTEESDFLVQLPDDAAVGVLQSEERFEWDNGSAPLQAGTALTFRVLSQIQITFKDKNSVSKDIFLRDQLKRLVKVGTVDFQQDACKAIPSLHKSNVMALLKVD